MKVGDLVKDNASGMLCLVTKLDDGSGALFGTDDTCKLWLGFKYLGHMEGLTFWAPAASMTIISSS